MHRATVVAALTLALASNVTGQSFEHDDVAPQCRAVCTNIANVADECERQYENVPNEDQQELDCLCSAQGMDSLIPECEACQRQYYGRDDDYDEIQTLLQRCSFSSMMATPEGTMTQMWESAESTVYTTTWTETDDDNETETEREAVTSYVLNGAAAQATQTGTATDLAGSASDALETATNAAGSAAGSATDAAGSATDAAGPAVEQSGNLAPIVTAAPVLAAVGVAAAVFGL